jgi:hypothetical protein
MTPRRRRHRRLRGHAWLALAFLLLTSALVYRVISPLRHFEPPVAARVEVDTASVPVRAALERHPIRPVYPYSIIRGGAYSPVELTAALNQDSVASAHYAGFHRETLRIIRAPEAMRMYASYRIGNAVYWTAHPVHVAAGETLITDGTNLARARCGNRLSTAQQEPVTRMEPMEREMDTPELNAPEVNFDNTLATHSPATPLSALAFDLFPPTTLSALQGATAISGGFAAPAATGSASAPASASPFNAPLAAVRPSSVPPSPVAQPWQTPVAEITEPSELNLQAAIETFPSTATLGTVLGFSAATPPLLPGVIIVPERFPQGSSPDGGFNGFGTGIPGQPTTSTISTTTSTSRQLLGAVATPGPETPGGNPNSPGGNPNSPTPGANTVPEPVAGVLVCAGLACLCLAARRFTPSSR